MHGTEIFQIERIPAGITPFSRRLAVVGSGLAHAMVVILGIWLSLLPRSIGSPERPLTSPRLNLVWLTSPGPAGGGGGGGDRTRVVAPAQQPGRHQLTAPTVRPKPAAVEKPKEPPPVTPLTIPALPMAAATATAPGAVLDPTPPAAPTQGSGTGGGAGTGSGTGSGEGQGSGLGAGLGGGTGGGSYRPGSGVTMPELVQEVKPTYTAEAMRAKLQGIVVLECVVQVDGTIGDVTIIKSIDKVFGLDQQAIKAAKGWRFRPGRRFGDPVPVIVTMELSFTLR
jgi:protein TonB